MTLWYLRAVKCKSKEPSSIPEKANDLAAWLPTSLHAEIQSCKICLHPVLCGIANPTISQNSCYSEFMKYILFIFLCTFPLFFPLDQASSKIGITECFLHFPLLIYICLLWDNTGWCEMWETFCTSLLQDTTSINGTDTAKYLPTGTN